MRMGCIIIQVDGRRRDVGCGVVLRLHRGKEASLGLLGPSLFSSMI
jgi:hypothetical protein